MKKTGRLKQLLALLLAGALTVGSVGTPVFGADFGDTAIEASAEEAVAEEITEEVDSAAVEDEVLDGGVSEKTDNVAAEESGAGAVSGDTAVPEDNEDSNVETYSVTLDANGGYFANEWDDVLNEFVERTEILNKVIPAGETVKNIVPIMEQDGVEMDFLGWSIEREGELLTQKNGEYVPVENCVLYAVWETEESTANVSHVPILEEVPAEDVIEGDDPVEAPVEKDSPVEETDVQEILDEGDVQEAEFVEDGEQTEAEQDAEVAEKSETVPAQDAETVDPQKAEEVAVQDATEETDQVVKEDQEPKAENAEAGDSATVKEAKDTKPEKQDATLEQNKTATIDTEEESVSEDAAMGVVASGTCGVNVIWELYENGTLKISGTGDMTGFGLVSQNSLVFPKNVIIDNGVTSIASGPFRDLTSIKIPDSVTSIGTGAFYGSSLKSVTIPNSVTSIGNFAFAGCRSLTSVTIPDSVTSIGESAFEDCSSLTSVTIPDSLTSIGAGAFNRTPWQKSMGAFAIINDILLAYQGDGTYVTIPDGVISIGAGAFRYCTSLKSVTIPKSVTSIAEKAFSGCSNLESITVQSENQYYSSIDGVLYSHNNDQTTLILCPKKKAGDYTIPEGVTKVSGSAFSGCEGLTSVTIPEGVEKIGDNAFNCCNSLTEMRFPASLTEIGSHAFANCYKLRYVKILQNVTLIDYSAFLNCPELRGVDIVSRQATFFESTFEYCEKVKLYVRDGSEALRCARNCNVNWDYIHLYLSDAVVTVPEPVYTGSPLTPEPIVEMYGEILREGVDYYVDSYTNNTDAGTAKVKVQATDYNGNYYGFTEADFVIKPASIKSAEISGLEEVVYTGTAFKPKPVVTLNGTILNYGTDYIVSWSNNTNIGTAKVTVTGTGNYTGKVTSSFVILPDETHRTVLEEEGTAITFPSDHYVYNGQAIKPVVIVKYGSDVLSENTDYSVSYSNNVKAGTAKAKIEGIRYYTGSVEASFTIKPASIDKAVVLSIPDQTYKGSAFKPAPAVRLGSKKLTAGTDYKVSYYSNTNAGTACVIINGKGNYKGTTDGTFTIQKAAPTLSFASTAVTKKTIDGAFTNKLSKKTDGKVTFTSSNKFVAAVDSSTGKITIRNAGKTTITAKAAAGNNYKAGSASYTLTVKNASAPVKYGIPETLRLGAGQTYTLKPSFKDPVFKTSSSKIAQVNSKGVITAKSEGTATIRVYKNNKLTASCKLTVDPAPKTVKLSVTKISLGVKETYTLAPRISDTARTKFTYSSGNTKIATVSGKGVITGVKAGKTTVTVKTHNNKKATLTVNVVSAPSKVAVGVTKLSLGVKESYTLAPTIPGGSHTTFTYSSGNTKIATVSSKGVIKGVKAGKTKITVKTHNNKTATLSLTVLNAPAKITLNKNKLVMNTGKTFQLKVTLPENSASAVTWKSSNTKVVTVDKKGKLTAKAAGTAKITAAAFNNKTAACSVTVSDDFVFSGRTLTKYKGKTKSVTIPAVNISGNTLLQIGESAFKGNTTVTKVSVPSTVNYIGKYAFKGCTTLKSITLPASLNKIDEQAFYGDTAIKTLDIPFGTTRILAKAFAKSGLEKIYLPDTVTFIADDAFDGLPDVIFYAPAGSYAEQYALEKDYQCEGIGTHYRKEEIQRQIDLLTELESAEGAEPIGEPEFSFFDTEGIEDEELLAVLEEANTLETNAKNAYDDYLSGAEDFVEAFKEFENAMGSFDIDTSGDGFNVNGGDFSYGIYGDAIQGLGNDIEILSTSASEDEEYLEVELMSGGKKYYLAGDSTGLVLYDQQNIVSSGSVQMKAITGEKAAKITADKLIPWLEQVHKIVTSLDFAARKITNTIESWLSDAQCAFNEAKATEDYLDTLSKSPWYSGDSQMNTRAAIAKSNRIKIQAKLTFVKSISVAWKTFNIAGDIWTLYNDYTRAVEILDIDGHNHPLQHEYESSLLRPIANDLNANIVKSYTALGCEAGASVVDIIMSFQSVTKVIKVAGGPLGILVGAIEGGAVKSLKAALTRFTLHLAGQEGISWLANNLYNKVINYDEKLHSYVFGKVTDKDTGEPIPRVEVTCGKAMVYTDSRGQYTIRVGQGLQTVAFKKQKYKTETADVDTGEGSCQSLDVEMVSNGILSGTVRDSVTGKPISGVMVSYGYYTTATNGNGFYQFSLPAGSADMSFSKKNYIREELSNVKVEVGKKITKNVLLTRKLDADQFRVVLSWGSTPADLDAHLLGPGYHVYFENKRGTNAMLDIDDTTSYGPETVTFKTTPGAEYTYYVHDYTNRNSSGSSALGGSGATVSVYNGAKLLGKYSVPKRSGIRWNVFKIKDGEIIVLNTMQ